MTERRMKKERIEDIAKRFVELNEESKSYIVGYMNGAQEERQRWEKKCSGESFRQEERFAENLYGSSVEVGLYAAGKGGSNIGRGI